MDDKEAWAIEAIIADKEAWAIEVTGAGAVQAIKVGGYVGLG